MPPMKATDEQPNSDNSQLLMAGTRQMEIEELSVTARKIDKPPIRATECACTFCTPLKSESSAGPCNRASLMTSKVNSAEATKLSKKENIYFYQYKKFGLAGSRSGQVAIRLPHCNMTCYQHANTRLYRIQPGFPTAMVLKREPHPPRGPISNKSAYAQARRDSSKRP